MTDILLSALRKLQKILTILEKRSLSWPTLTAIRSGLMLTLPLIMLGSFAILFNKLPIPPYQEMMHSLFGPEWTNFGQVVWNGTFGLISVISLLSIGYFMSERHNQSKPTMQSSPMITGLICLASLVSLITVQGGSLAQQWTGTAGLFSAIIVAVLASKLFLFLSGKGWLRLLMLGGNTDFSVPLAFSSILPGALTVSVFSLAGLLIYSVSGVSAHEALYELIRIPFGWAGEGLGRALLYVLSLDSLWFLGISGANVLDPITQAIYNSAAAENIAAHLAWHVPQAIEALLAALNASPAAVPPAPQLPHIFTKTMLDSFVFMGGSGCTLSLTLALLLFGKHRAQKRLAVISLVPGIFNINEILLFGLPVVLNPTMLIPFLLLPPLLTIISYGAIAMGLIPPTAAAVDWTTPVLLSGYLSTGSPRGIALQLFNLAIGVAFYAPFILASEKVKRENIKEAFALLLARAVNINTVSNARRCLDSPDSAGALANGLLIDLEIAFSKREGIYLEFQPQITAQTRKVFGVESLLRWNHPLYGPVPAPITVTLAEESGLIDPLGLFIFETACATRRRWLDEGVNDLIMAVNFSPLQLKPGLPRAAREILDRHNVPPHLMEVEITESSALDPSNPENAVLQELNSIGLRLVIDDFGMGHSSLKYLKQFPVDVVKIDGAITNEITTNPICADIVLSITRLCRARDIISVVEFVETEEQVEILKRHGCDVLQGYLFSKPLPEEECLRYIERNKEGVALPR